MSPIDQVWDVSGPLPSLSPTEGDQFMSVTTTLPALLAPLLDSELLAFTCFGEAANQPLEAQAAIMLTIRNRALTKGQLIGAVCLHPQQYACWTEDSSVTHARLVGAVRQYLDSGRSSLNVDRPVLRQLLHLAQGVVSGAILDSTDRATHYLPVTVWKQKPPGWVSGKRPTRQYGDFVFFAGVLF